MSAGNGRIRSVDGLMRPAVAGTVAKLDQVDVDAAAVRLAERYAAQIDEAAVIAADLADVTSEDEDTAKVLYALRKRVEAHQVLIDLGPKLLAVLESLGATPKGRAALGKGPVPAGPGRLAGLRAARGA